MTTRKPDRREKMALAAPYDNIAAHLVAETPRDDSHPEGKHRYRDDKHDYQDKNGDGSHSTCTYDPASASRCAHCPV